ncbi:uncharacterized protein LOC127700727 [Mytilus californianus]|uniref:uncharacterized protein LOC127700727 n=1 Tax=Mytilus californianus TaxID=6549 RepID=UPI002247771B|nr:uncharacterized protein LOC127700727 [Mytilus californianus]
MIGILYCLGMVLIVTVYGQIPPGDPTIIGPSEILLNDNVTLTCSSAGGDPLPTLTWLRGDVRVTTTQTTVNGITSSTLNFIASREYHLQVFECQVDNKVLQNYLVRTFSVELLITPDPPVINGPSFLISGQSGTWTCTSINGYHAPSISMEIESKHFDDITVVSKYDTSSKAYIVTGSVNWAPTTANDGQTILCEVRHQTLTSPQTVGLSIAVNASDTFPTHIPLFSTEITWGEIVAIVLGIFFFLLLFVVCGLLQGCCVCCCGSSAGIYKEKREAKLTYQVAIIERERKDYEITKYEIVEPEKHQVMEHDNLTNKRTSISTTSTTLSKPPFPRPYHIPGRQYTYEEEERRRQMWKKNKRTRHHSDVQMEDQIVLQERIVSSSLSNE